MTTSLSHSIYLEFSRKQAKDLRRGYEAGNPDAIERVRRHHPQHGEATSASTAGESLSLREAQLVVAREQGFDGWTQLKEVAAGAIGDQYAIRVCFLGARGSTTQTSASSRKYGGRTPCVMLAIGTCADDSSHGTHLILDAGSGLAALPEHLGEDEGAREDGEYHILLSHFHHDHLEGLRSFAPLFTKGTKVTFYGDPVDVLQSAVEGVFSAPYFPMHGLESLPARVVFLTAPLRARSIAGVKVKAFRNRHPGGCITYRIQHGPCVVVYSTDHEIGDSTVDASLVALARNADLWILDGQFTPDERAQRQGWGHSSHLEAVELALQAGVKTLVVFHHDPNRDDDSLDRMERESARSAAAAGTRVVMARDNMVLNVPGD